MKATTQFKLPLIVVLMSMLVLMLVNTLTVSSNTDVQNEITSGEVGSLPSEVSSVSDEELVGVDYIQIPVTPFRAIVKDYTSTQILSRNDVKLLFKNMNNVNNASALLGGILGYNHPILGAVVGLGSFQNPSLRNAITKAYYQNKRLKIVMKSGAAMSLRKVYYYVIN